VSAQPIGTQRPEPWHPDPRRQRLANYTIEDVLSLPEDAPRVELVDGVMLVVPSPTVGHQYIGNLVWLWLRDHAPTHLRPTTAVGVVVAGDTTYEPDVVLHRVETDPDHHYLKPEEIVLVVEVVSPGTRRRDRFDKPSAYADAGIPYYWRVEQNPVHVFAYKLSHGKYEEVGNSAEELVLDEPFAIRLPISEITPR
jgi:Uma2 family endonuclease